MQICFLLGNALEARDRYAIGGLARGFGFASVRMDGGSFMSHVVLCDRAMAGDSAVREEKTNTNVISAHSILLRLFAGAERVQFGRPRCLSSQQWSTKRNTSGLFWPGEC